ncbi:MAG: sugar O-acetyltransferase [Algoriphagus sp.]|jgi:maltose O-acetyltransferase|uniref:sugar O-acetyltransferase n=1 Tax=Algoriphagus sp. TaxID=1872435 RepID=UPI00261D64C7|nr:sugar O-acetyltransferase [Algoriphagus sp.]MDG1278642.1 sugar O-acetyltransferase [Algoriphagus sp.]
MTEKEKMLSGQLYQAGDPELVKERLKARKLIKTFNNSDPEGSEFRISLLRKLLGSSGKNIWIEPPFYCDYGSNIHVGDDVFFNFNCVVLDVTPVRLGDRVFVAPNVQFYAATHPIDAKIRGELWEFGKAITIGNDVWIGGASVICPGVTIGDRVVIGAGSVVTKSFPSDVVIAGNPARIIRKIEA